MGKASRRNYKEIYRGLNMMPIHTCEQCKVGCFSDNGWFDTEMAMKVFFFCSNDCRIKWKASLLPHRQEEEPSVPKKYFNKLVKCLKWSIMPATYILVLIGFCSMPVTYVSAGLIFLWTILGFCLAVAAFMMAG